MAMNINYSWKLFHKSFSFRLPWFGRRQDFQAFKKFKISCGCWLSVVTDEVAEITQSTRGKVRQTFESI